MDGWWCGVYRQSDINAASVESVVVTLHALVKAKCILIYASWRQNCEPARWHCTAVLVPQHLLNTKCNEPSGHRGPLKLSLWFSGHSGHLCASCLQITPSEVALSWRWDVWLSSQASLARTSHFIVRNYLKFMCLCVWKYICACSGECESGWCVSCDCRLECVLR